MNAPLRFFFASLFALSLICASFAQSTTVLSATSENNLAAKKVLTGMAALTAESYIAPPEIIEKLVLAPRHLNTNLSDLSPDGKYFLVARSGGMPSLGDLGKPYYNLGGQRVDFRANRERALSVRGSVAIELWDASNGAKRNIEMPKDARVSSASWSPDGSQIAFLAHFKDATHLYVADVKSGKSKRLTKSPLLATLATGLQWTANGKIACVLVPEKRMDPPKTPETATQPLVQLTDSGRNRHRTYPALLKNAQDQALLEYYATGQLALIDSRNGSVSKFGAPTMVKSFDFSPDGNFARVTVMEKPFSYVVPISNFGDKEEIWNQEGKALAEIQKRPLRLAGGGTDDQPGGEAQQQSQKRNIAWRPDGQGLTYLEQEQAPRRENPDDPPALTDEQGRGGGRFGGGQGGQQTGPPRKDRVYQWVAPFAKENAKVIYESDQRIDSVSYSADCQTLFISETRSGSENLFAVRLNELTKKLNIFSARTGQETLNRPGSLMTTDGPNGRRIVRVSSDGKRVFLQGTQYSEDPNKQAPRPFIDSVEIETAKKERIWQSSEVLYETVSEVLDNDVSKIVINRQSRTRVPNSYFLDLSAKSEKPLTQNVDYAPEISMARYERFQVTRPDGFKFWVQITMPQQGERFPAFFWFYPREFTDQRTYDRGFRTRNNNTFPTFGASSKQFLVALGYAVVEPDFPIVGPTGRMNDSYVPDLRSNMWTIIDSLDKKGYIDRDRLGIGGHSYGAFSTANVLVHTPYFKAGIAGDGAYNRLLTPGGFQTEQRQLWESRETYLTMSPLLYAEQMTGALLMYHGLDDQNVGTFPINSERLFVALENLGKTASVGSSRVDLQACKLEYSIVSPK